MGGKGAGRGGGLLERAYRPDLLWRRHGTVNAPPARVVMEVKLTRAVVEATNSRGA